MTSRNAASSHIDAIFALLDRDDDQVNKNVTMLKSECTMTALIRDGNLEKVKEIIQSQAIIDPNIRRLRAHRGRTILQEACIQKQKDIVKFLLDEYSESIDVNKKSYMSQDTALHYAVTNNDIGMIKMLLNHGSNPNERNKYGATPLHYVSSVDIADLLHCYGADSTAVDTKGLTPREYIFKNGALCSCSIGVGGMEPLVRYLENMESEALERELRTCTHRRQIFM